MIAAKMAGIRIFATGGIGGVHRGAAETFDISADLQELAHTNIAVVCAGIKSILDIGLTLEYLETMGVPVIGYNTDELPSFYSRKSGFPVDFNLKTPLEIANYLNIKNQIGLENGVIIAQPIPVEFDFDSKIINTAIEKALILQKELGIKGKESTPFLLSKVKEFTHGESLISNIALVKNNVQLASEIAVSLHL
jgi:pseudouridine-5'-phosphate glycosidase